VSQAAALVISGVIPIYLRAEERKMIFTRVRAGEDKKSVSTQKRACIMGAEAQRELD
jgi:hypothetical protein